jgi:hypothetical protein
MSLNPFLLARARNCSNQTYQSSCFPLNGSIRMAFSNSSDISSHNAHTTDSHDTSARCTQLCFRLVSCFPWPKRYITCWKLSTA